MAIGYRKAVLEVCLPVRPWLERVYRLLHRGRFLVIDYGHSARELARFPMATLMSYQDHAADPNVLTGPGTRDITTHVNFSHLRETAIGIGFEVVREESLQRWALRLCETPKWMQLWKGSDTKWRLQWKQLVFGMGRRSR